MLDWDSGAESDIELEAELEGEGRFLVRRRPARFRLARRRETRELWMDVGVKSDVELALDGEAGFSIFDFVSTALASGPGLPSG